MIGLNENLEMVKFKFKRFALVVSNQSLHFFCSRNFVWYSNAAPSQFAYPPMTKPKQEKAKTKVKTAELSYTKKASKKGKYIVFYIVFYYF
jgi:hypothetical protein